MPVPGFPHLSPRDIKSNLSPGFVRGSRWDLLAPGDHSRPGALSTEHGDGVSGPCMSHRLCDAWQTLLSPGPSPVCDRRGERSAGSKSLPEMSSPDAHDSACGLPGWAPTFCLTRRLSALPRGGDRQGDPVARGTFPPAWRCRPFSPPGRGEDAAPAPPSSSLLMAAWTLAEAGGGAPSRQSDGEGASGGMREPGDPAPGHALTVTCVHTSGNRPQAKGLNTRKLYLRLHLRSPELPACCPRNDLETWKLNQA